MTAVRRGFFLTFEGPDGGGKTTQARRLADWLVAQGYPVVATREPGGTLIGEKIRHLVHDCANQEMTPLAEILLYSASRAQLTQQIIRPALEAGKLVVCDRYFDSTYAYQGYGRGLSLPDLQSITAFATGGLQPDLTFCLDVPSDLGIARRKRSGGEFNRLNREALEFHVRVRRGYQALIERDPDRWCVVDAARDLDDVQDALRHAALPRLESAVREGRIERISPVGAQG